MTGCSKVLRILNEQRCSGKLCDINFKLDTDFRVWAHFSVIAAQSEYVGNKYFVQTEMQFSIQNPLTITLQRFECELCLQNVVDFMYSMDDEDIAYPENEPAHKPHVQQLARLLSIGELLKGDLDVMEIESDAELTMAPKAALQVEDPFEAGSEEQTKTLVPLKRPRPKPFQYKIQTQPSQSKIHKCLGCAFKCYKPPDMLFHMKNCSSKNTKCNMCDKHFDTMTEFKGHLVRHEHHKPFFCCDCDLRFSTKTALNLHTPKHSQKTPHACHECGKSFKWKHGLDNHMIVHSTEKQLLCDECGYSTSHLKTLRAHQLSHTGFLYRCTTTGCNYSSRRKENLKIHIATHRNETPFVCEVCGHRFSQNKNLKRHALLHVANNLYKCLHCEFTNYRTDKMKEHILRQHTEKPLQLELAEVVPSALDTSDVIVGNKRKHAATKNGPPRKAVQTKNTAPAFILPKGLSPSEMQDFLRPSTQVGSSKNLIPKSFVSTKPSSQMYSTLQVNQVRDRHPSNKGLTFILPKISTVPSKVVHEEPIIDINTAVIIT